MEAELARKLLEEQIPEHLKAKYYELIKDNYVREEIVNYQESGREYQLSPLESYLVDAFDPVPQEQWSSTILAIDRGIFRAIEEIIALHHQLHTLELENHNTDKKIQQIRNIVNSDDTPF